jgi:hypothetical protein
MRVPSVPAVLSLPSAHVLQVDHCMTPGRFQWFWRYGLRDIPRSFSARECVQQASVMGVFGWPLDCRLPFALPPPLSLRRP